MNTNPYKAFKTDRLNRCLRRERVPWRIWIVLGAIPLVGLAASLSVLVATNLLGGPYIADSEPTTNHLYWWGIAQQSTSWIVSGTVLAEIIVLVYQFLA